MTDIKAYIRNNMTTVTEADLMYFGNDFLGQEGVVDKDSDDCKVSEKSGAPNMSVDVAIGSFYLPLSSFAENSKLMKYVGGSITAIQNAVIAPNASGNPRIDKVCIEFLPGASPASDGDDVFQITVVQGTPAGSPVAPATPNNHLALATVAVANGASSIVNANITDLRVNATIKANALEQGLDLLNNKFVQGKTVAGNLRKLIGMSAGDKAQIGDENINEVIFLSGFGLPEGYMINGKITRSVASNNLTVAIKTLAGNDPSATDPVFVVINGSLRKISSALSITLNAGTNWFNSGGTGLTGLEVDYFIYLGWRSASSTVFIGIARMPWGVIYSDFNATNTNNKYLGYSGSAPASTDVLHLVGRVNATLTGTNWSVPATSVIINKPIDFTRKLVLNRDFITGFTVNPVMNITYQIISKNIKLDFYNTGMTGTYSGANIVQKLPFDIDKTHRYGVTTMMSVGAAFYPCWISNDIASGNILYRFINPATNALATPTAAQTGALFGTVFFTLD